MGGRGHRRRPRRRPLPRGGAEGGSRIRPAARRAPGDRAPHAQAQPARATAAQRGARRPGPVRLLAEVTGLRQGVRQLRNAVRCPWAGPRCRGVRRGRARGIPQQQPEVRPAAPQGLRHTPPGGVRGGRAVGLGLVVVEVLPGGVPHVHGAVVEGQRGLMDVHVVLVRLQPRDPHAVAAVQGPAVLVQAPRVAGQHRGHRRGAAAARRAVERAEPARQRVPVHVRPQRQQRGRAAVLDGGGQCSGPLQVRHCGALAPRLRVLSVGTRERGVRCPALVVVPAVDRGVGPRAGHHRAPALDAADAACVRLPGPSGRARGRG